MRADEHKAKRVASEYGISWHGEYVVGPLASWRMRNRMSIIELENLELRCD